MTNVPVKFVHELNKNTILWRGTTTNKLQNNTFFALNQKNAAKYGNTRNFKPNQNLKLLKLNIGSLDWLVNQYKNNNTRKGVIEAARNHSFPTIEKNKNGENMNTHVMGRFSNFDNKTLESERAILNAIRRVGLGGYIINKAVPVARMNKKWIATSSVFRPELAIVNAPNKIARVPALTLESPTPQGTPGTPRTPPRPRTGTPPKPRKLF